MGCGSLYNHELTLVSKNVNYDDYGNPIVTENKINILCKKKSIGRTEFYDAATEGMKPEVIFVIHGYEYNNQQKIEFEGTTYKVLKTYSVDFEEIELTCEKDVAS